MLQRLLFPILLCSLIFSCQDSNQTSNGETLEAGINDSPSDASSQLVYHHIDLLRDTLDSKVQSVNNDVADHALRIASYIFNSKEFQDSMRQRDFDYHNICDGCDINDLENQPRITGKRVLDSIFRNDKVSLSLLLKKVGVPPVLGKCFGLGNTCPNTNFITSFYKNINCDMSDELPFEYAYAVHLCHEYAHNVGYCHTYEEDDIAESVGWVAFHFMSTWYEEGTRVP